MKKIVFLIIIFMMPSFCFAGEIKSEPQKLFDFASNLYNEGNYYGAVIEYQRLLNYFPDSKFSKDALYMSGMGYLKAGKNNEAARTFDSFISFYREDPLSQDALFKIAESHFTSNHYNTGILKLSEYKNIYNSQGTKDTCDYLIGWGYLSKHRFDESRSVFYHLGEHESEYKLKSKGIAGDLIKSNSLPSKSPAVAGIMSAIIPGSGQIYAGRFYDGMVSFLLNASFLYLAAEGFRTENNSAGLFFGIIELGWYSSNIYGAINSAHKYNKEVKDDFVKGLKDKYEFHF